MHNTAYPVLITDQSEKQAIARAILTALPDWFGLPDALCGYVKKAGERPLLLFGDKAAPIGFLTLTRHNPHTWEIDVMGVLPQAHRQGIGRALVEAAAEYCRNQGAVFLTVKTLDESAHSAEYDRTRAFYLKMGFIPLEVFPTLWDEWNPCLMLARCL